MSKQIVITLLGGLPLGFRLSALKEDDRFYAVSKIRQHSKAEKSGLQLGDIILRVNGINCEGLSHATVTALTDISDVLNMLVLRNAKSSSEVIKAFSNLGESARRLTPKEIADLTGNQNLTVTRRQSTGCISQTPPYDHHRQTPFKLFGSQKVKQNNFSNLVKSAQKEEYLSRRSDSEERKVEENGRMSEKRRERHNRTENGSQKRHLVPSRLKNIAQTAEVLEKELEEELKRELNLQMFEETSKNLAKQSPDRCPDLHRNRSVRCASEEPRYKTNMQFKLSTDEIKKNQKVPMTQTKVSIRRFSLVVPGENTMSTENTLLVPRNKLTITPLQMRPLTAAPISRRAQFSIRSNSIIGIPKESVLLNDGEIPSRNAQLSRQSHNIKTSQALTQIPHQVLHTDNQRDKQDNTKIQSSVRISSSSTKKQVMPATRIRSNSLSVLSTARNPLISFSRPTNFSLSTGSNKVNERSSTDGPSFTMGKDKSSDNQTVAAHQHTDPKTVDLIQNTSTEFQEAKSESKIQIPKERKLSFSSQSRALNPLPMVNMPKNAVTIQNKSVGTVKAYDYSAAVFPKEAIAMPNRMPSSVTLPLKTPGNDFRTSYHGFKPKEEIANNSAQQQPLRSANYWNPVQITNSDLSEKYTHDFHTHGIVPPFGWKHTAFPQMKSYYNLPQASNSFQQNAPYGRKFGADQLKLSSSRSSTAQTFTPPQMIANERPAFDAQQHSQFSLQQNQTNNLSSNSFANQINTSQIHNYNVPQRSHQPIINPGSQMPSAGFNVSSRGQQSTRERFERSSFVTPSHFEESGTQSNFYPTNNPWSPSNPQMPAFNRTYASQQNTYSTLPHNFKSRGHNFASNSSFSQSYSLPRNSSRNMWQPNASSMDLKSWDHAKTN